MTVVSFDASLLVARACLAALHAPNPARRQVSAVAQDHADRGKTVQSPLGPLRGRTPRQGPTPELASGCTLQRWWSVRISGSAR